MTCLVCLFAGSSSGVIPTEMASSRLVLDQVTLATFTHQLGTAFGDIFLGGPGMVSGPDSFDGFKPECVGHMLGRMINPDPLLRLDPDWMRGHFATFCRDYQRQADFLFAVGSNVWGYVSSFVNCKRNVHNIFGAALDKLGVSTALVSIQLQLWSTLLSFLCSA